MNAERELHIAAVILAAGTSRRMGDANKLLLSLGGTPIVARVVEAVRSAPIEDVIVVTGHERTSIEEALIRYPVRLVHNANYASGMASSIRCGVEAASPNADGIMIGLGDMPLVQSETLQRLCHRFADVPRPAIIFPVYDGRRGHPVLFDTAFREELRQLRGDIGGRPVVRAHKTSVVEVEVDDPGVVYDIDTQAAYDVFARAVENEGGVTGAGRGPQ